MTPEELFDLFVVQILNGGYVKDGEFCTLDPCCGTAATSLVPVSELKSNFVRAVTENAQKYLRLCDRDDSIDEFDELEHEILGCIPALYSYNDDDVNFFSTQLLATMESLRAALWERS